VPRGRTLVLIVTLVLVFGVLEDVTLLVLLGRWR